MAESLTGKVAAITGGAQGIGREIARQLVAEGVMVGIGDLDLEAAERTAKQLGPNVRAFDLDVTSPEKSQAFVRATEDAFGPLDIMINNAGIMIVGEFVKESQKATDLQIDVNVRGVLNGCKAALSSMLDRSSGHIVNIASAAGKLPSPRLATYTASKHAVVGLSDSLRAELVGTGVHVSTVMPVPVNTRLGAHLGSTIVPPVEPEDVAATVIKLLKKRRNEAFVPGYAELIHASVRWLPSEGREWITRALRFDNVMNGADDAAREQYQREAIETQRARA